MNLKTVILDKIKMDTKLIPLQFSILEKLKHNNFVFVFDEVGCGKTIEAGIAVWYTLENGGKNILIVAPSNLVFNWYNEMIAKFGIDFKIIGGTADSIDLYYNDYNIGKLSNLCIVSYDSRISESSNAALDRLQKINIEWDLIVLDEGHESKNESSKRYNTLSTFNAKKVVFLSATPIKNLQEDFQGELNLVSEILEKGNIFDINNFSPEKAISFDLTYPISRNFKEMLMELGGFKQRNVNNISYTIAPNIVIEINNRYSGLELDQKRGSIFLFDRIFQQNSTWGAIYQIYKKSTYTQQDFNNIKSFDDKFSNLVQRIDKINLEENIVIFCNHREVVDYLKKMLACKYGQEYVEAIHGESYSTEERKNRIFLLDKNDNEMNQKRILILSHNIGSVGINLSRFSHIFNYELPYTPADLEQRFGRIDRITNKSKQLNMYLFTDSNDQFDNIYFRRIIEKMMREVLPLLPSKNILFLSNRTIKVYLSIIESFINLQSHLDNISDEGDLNEEGLKKELLKQLNIAISINNNKVRIYDVEQQKDIDFKTLKENLKKIIETIFTNMGIVDTSNMQQKVQEYVTSMQNKVSYMVNGQQKNLSFDDLIKMVDNSNYQVFKKDMDIIDKEIDFTIEKLNEKYRQLNDIEGFLDFIIKEIDNQGINDHMTFSVLYGVWSCLVKVDNELTFQVFMNAYNERSC